MGFKEIVKNFGSKNKEKREILKRMLEQDRMENTVEERKKSANQRELESYHKENYESKIKEELEYMRKKRRDDITFNHNPIDVKNITSGTQWEVLKEKNQFKSRGNMFANQPSTLRGDKNLLKNKKSVLKSKKLFTVRRGRL